MSPHLLLAVSTLHNLVLATTSKTKSSSSGFTTIIFVLIIGAVAYMFLIRPQRNRARRQQQTQQTIQLGDEVMLTSGIIGRVTWLEGDRARLEIAPNTEIEVVRAALGRKVESPLSDPDVGLHPDGISSHEDDDSTVHLPYGFGGTEGEGEETSLGEGGGHPDAASDGDETDGA